MFRAIAEQIKAHREYRKVYTQLSQMSRRELADIGLTPGDIEAVARGRFPVNR